ncbi:MAG: PspC domain-containing protein [Cyclobacteriaceae bacterium]
MNTLSRSSSKIIAGVCGGIAKRFGWDPTIVRLLYVIISVLSAAFPGTIVYIVLWIIVPKEGRVLNS